MRQWIGLVVCSAAALSGGCGLIKSKFNGAKHDTKLSYHDNYGMQIEYPDVTECVETPPSAAAQQTLSPFALEDPATLPSFELSLEEAIHMAVEQSPVLRSIGGTVVSAPVATATVYDPSLTSASPAQGTEAALSAFDAQYTQQLYWFTTDRPNNVNPGGVTAVFTPSAQEGTSAVFSNELSKQTAQGASFAFRHVVNYSRNNQPFRAFTSAFDGYFEAEWRQPLLQGAGTTFNRIAGPSTVPGQYNGILIARLNEDVALADFEGALIDLVADVEQAYWDLVVAYRVLNTQVQGREAAQQTYQFQQVRLEIGSGRSDEEAQARSQFYQFQAQVEAALGGPNGLYALEQRLRYLIGLPASDGRIIRPSTEPLDTKVVFDWESAVGQSLDRRIEIRRQMLAVKRRELELTAARLNLRPRLDFLAQYRWRGLGNHLIGRAEGSALENLYRTISTGDYQEAQAGFEMNLPVGFRAASNAVAHARLNVRRERALLAETELRISHDLSDSARQVALTHRLMETNYNRFVADIKQVDVLRRRYIDGNDNINFLLQAQRQAVISASEFYRSIGNYNLAIRDFHRQKGSLLAYNQVQLSEGPWAAGASRDAYEVGRFLTPRRSPEKVTAPRPLTRGLFDPAAVQNTSPAVEGEIIEAGTATPDAGDGAIMPVPDAASGEAELPRPDGSTPPSADPAELPSPDSPAPVETDSPEVAPADLDVSPSDLPAPAATPPIEPKNLAPANDLSSRGPSATRLPAVNARVPLWNPANVSP